MNYVKSIDLNLKIKGLHHQVTTIYGLENLSLWQKLSSFGIDLYELSQESAQMHTIALKCK